MLDEKKEADKFRLQLLRDIMLFYGVLIFTCVLGMIELIPELKPLPSSELPLVTIIYFGLLFGLIYSFSRCWDIYKESIELTVNLGKEYLKYPRPHLIDFTINIPWLRFITILILFSIFALLYVVKIV